MANLITFARLVLVFVAIGLIYRITLASELTALGIVVSVIALDWVDGAVARRTGSVTEAGAVLDVLADRIIENSLWIVFADIGLVPIWIPLAVLVRGLATDAVRALALRRGLTPFGETTMMRSRLGRALVSSRASRAAYAVAKLITFAALILLLAASAAMDAAVVPAGAIEWLYPIALALAYFTAVFTLVRGVPVVIDGWYLLRRD
jgi:CDP-diacylglycerol--glycerol-3-phosphate 3-phosphatidyltransferase